MKIEILDRAEQDLVEGFHFYEAQQVGWGHISSSICTLTLNRSFSRLQPMLCD